MNLRTILILSSLVLLTACSTTDALKQPCQDPGILSYVDDCGPMMPVNESFDEILVTP